MPSLIEGLLKEIKRNRELVAIYKTIPTGIFAASIVEAEIKTAEQAMADGDTIEMLTIFTKLKSNEA